MKEHPILFTGPMVRAILEGRKTQTRRPVKAQPPASWQPTVGTFHPTKVDRKGVEFPGEAMFGASDETFGCRAPCAVGDRLWVRETFAYVTGNGIRLAYRADGEDPRAGWDDVPPERRPKFTWMPSIHMPRWASRITLEVTAVRPERVKGIPQSDAIAEGIEYRPAKGMSPGGSGTFCVGKNHHASTPREAFALLWDSIYGGGPLAWTNNPWVWAATFKVVAQ